MPRDFNQRKRKDYSDISQPGLSSDQRLFPETCLPCPNGKGRQEK